MRILIINDYGFRNGGVEAFQQRHQRALTLAGHEVKVFTSNAAVAGQKLFSDYACTGTLSRSRALLQTANLSAPFALRQALKHFKPDIVHLNDFLTQLSPLILPVLREWPTVHYVQWQRIICPTGTRLLPSSKQCTVPAGLACLREGCLPFYDWLPLMAQRKLTSYGQTSLNHIVAISSTMQTRLHEAGIEASTVIPYGVEVSHRDRSFSPAPSLLYQGRLVPAKGVHILLEAFQKVLAALPQTVLHILGDGPQRPQLEALAASLHLNNSVIFYGWTAQPPPVALDAWLHVTPALWEEPFGLVVLEAAAHGIPSVTSDLGGLAENVIQGQTGWKLPPGDPDLLAATLIELLSDPARISNLGLAAREHVQRNFNFDHCIDRWQNLYHTLY